MSLGDIILLSWRNLMANKMRSLLTILGIAVGIATIVFLVSLGYGLQELSIKKITSISSLTAIDVTPAQSSIEINDEVLKELEKIENVEKTSPLLSLAGQIALNSQQTDIVGYAVKDDYFGFQGLKTSVGGIFTDDTQIVISTGVAKALDSTPNDLIGKEIDFIAFFGQKGKSELTKKNFKYKIAGVIDDNSSSFAYFPLTDSLKGTSAVYNSAKVKIASTDKLETVKSVIQSKGYKASSIADTISQVYQIFKVIQIVLASFGIIALLVASIGTFNTMTIALLERTRDIGIMKSVGVQNSTVRKLFLTESLLISFLGGAFGAALGILISFTTNFLVNTLAVSVGGQSEKLFSIPINIILIIVGFSVLVGIITGFYPAKRASKLNPLEALRYE